MSAVDFLFPVLGSELPTDHQYPLFAAVTTLLPWLHDNRSRYALAPLTGVYVGDGRLRLLPGWSKLRIRLLAVDIPRVLPLAGKGLRVAGQRLRLGVPHVEALQPVQVLRAHTVVIKHATEPDTFLQAARKQLDALEIKGRIEVPLAEGERDHGQPQRHVLRVKDYTIIGYPLLVRDLTSEASLRLQEIGIGGKRHMGGGFFLPIQS
ncbi:MAG TPA: type I-MYXAN CRISPR-associated protein Cas6/Cmx6 [Gemmataceae bacterium]|jgi:CRISPR-associated endonuclease/helicase Cas3